MSEVALHRFVAPAISDQRLLGEVDALATDLHQLLSTPATLASLAQVQSLGAHSSHVQSVIWPHAQSLGFSSEKKGLFADYETAALRPDMYRAVGSSGIILEVERGKTLRNNMDLLDLWKTHICKVAHYLFLFVPQANERTGGREAVYPAVLKRLGSFYDPANLTNVRATYVFGY